MSALRRLAIVASCLAFACSGDGDPAVPDGAGAADASAAAGSSAGSGDAGDAAAAALEVTGAFVLTLVPEVPATADRLVAPAYTKLLGQALAAASPSAIVWTLTADEGGCQLFEPSLPFCDPKCANGTVCVDEGVCAGYPRALDLGDVTLRGVRTEQGGDSVVAKPLPPSNNYQLPGSPRLAYPPFAPGDELTIEAEGGELTAFSIAARGIAPLELIGEGDIDFSPDAVTEVRWEPAPSEGTRVLVIVDVSHHGGRTGELRCESDDEGALDIPAALGAKLIELGAAGNPTLQVIRESFGSVPLSAGEVGLSVQSPITRGLRIPGLISCDEPGAQSVCPDGQLCLPQHRCG